MNVYASARFVGFLDLAENRSFLVEGYRDIRESGERVKQR